MVWPAVVIATDFSEGSRRAIQAVKVLGRNQPTPILLLHVFPPRKLRIAGAERRTLQNALARGETAEAAQLSATAEELRKAGFPVETKVIQGKTAASLLLQAKRRKAGLIALGTTGRPGVKGLFIGSVAQAVLRDSSIPVLVTPARKRQGRYKAGAVLAAINFDEEGPTVLKAAAELAKDLGLPLRVVHCVSLPFVEGYYPEAATAYTPELLAADETDAVVRLTDMVENLRQDVKVKVVVGVGEPVTYLLAHAAQMGAAAIVLGRRKSGRRLGSVAAAVVQSADRPVLVIPASPRPSNQKSAAAARAARGKKKGAK